MKINANRHSWPAWQEMRIGRKYGENWFEPMADIPPLDNRG
jgi:hypothetical protein